MQLGVADKELREFLARLSRLRVKSLDGITRRERRILSQHNWLERQTEHCEDRRFHDAHSRHSEVDFTWGLTWNPTVPHNAAVQQRRADLFDLALYAGPSAATAC
jgi:hypothetical protein